MRIFTAVILLIIVGGVIPGALSTPVHAENPFVNLTGFSLNPSTLAPGGTSVANVTIKNENLNESYGVTVSFTATSPLSIIGSGSTFYIGDMNGSTSHSFPMTIGASPTASSGDYAMPYVVNFLNATNGLRKEALSSSGQVYIAVSGTPLRPLLTVTQVSFSPSIITPGIQFTTGVNITNSGTEASFGSTLTVSPGPDLSLVGTTGIVALTSLAPGQHELVGVRMATNPSAPTESVPVKFVLNYIDKFGTPFSSNDSYTVQITATPELKVQSFQLSSAPLRPGSNAFLTITMINVGGDRAYDVKLSASASFFLTGTSINYLGAIDSGGHASASFYLNVSSTEPAGNYLLALNAVYSDLTGKLYSTQNNYTIPVEPYAPPAVGITSTVIDPPVLSAGSQGTITLFLKNTGTTEARNVTIRVEGANGILTSSYLGVGTMEPGDTVTQVIGVNVRSNLPAGSYLLDFVVAYSNPTGNSFSTTLPLETHVYEAVNVFTLMNIAIITGVVILALVVLVVLRRFKFI